MKHYLCLPLFLFLSTALFSAPDGKGEKKRPNFPSREEMIKKFDSDGDGKLSDEEREKARKQMPGKGRKLPPEVLQKFDKDGDGKLSDEERAAFRKQMVANGRKLPPHLMQRFDTDGDGTLSDEERAGAKQAWEDRKQEMIKKFDANGDGKLSVEERREAIKQAKLGDKTEDSQKEELSAPAGKKADKAPKKETKGEGKKPKEKKKDS